ncbi:MAG: ABC transporter substrate-binding protein [Candidatus Methylomirabilia bacterium]
MIRKVTILTACAALLAALPAAAAETIKIGAILAVTGPAAFLGAPEAKTLEMLAAEVNAAGGVKGMKIELLIKDSSANPEKAVSLAKQLVEEEKVFAILGPSTSGESLNIKQYMDENATLLLSCAAAEKITTPVMKWVFKTTQNDANAVRWILTDLKKKGLTKIGVLASSSGFGKAGKEQLEKFAPEYGIEIVIAEIYDTKAVDLDAEVTKLKSKEVQAVVNWSVEPAQSKVPVSMRKMSWMVPLYQSHGFGNIKYVEAAGPAAEGIIFPAGRLLVANGLPDTNAQKALLLKYKKDYAAVAGGEEASTFGGHAYDAFTLLVKAIEIGGPDKEKARAALEGLKGFVGTAGIFNFSAEDHNGLGMDSFELLTVKDGKFALAP